MSAPTPILSLCIPTWNRAGVLGDLFRSIVPQLRDEVEVVVADNASVDGTTALVQSFRRLIPRLVYTRAHVNAGFDANLGRLVRAAHGQYVWFIGSDDRVWPGAVARVLDSIQNAPGAIIVGDVVTGNERVEPSTAWPDYSVFHFDEPGRIERYLEQATSIRATGAFLSNVIFPKDGWPPKPPIEWRLHSYRHLFSLWRLLLDGRPLVTRQKVFVYAAIGFPLRRDRETAAAVKQAVDAVACLTRMVEWPRDRTALRRVWNLEYPEARVASLEERCHHEPAWPFIKSELARLLRGGTD
jgi:glycosyltransferase involved in cell wall biosynthesis